MDQKIDIKEKRILELEFPFSEIQLSMLDNDTDKIVILDRDRTIVFFNETYKKLGSKLYPEKKLNVQIGQVFTPQTHNEIWNHSIDQALEGNYCRFFLSYIFEGNILTDVISISPIKNNDQTVKGCTIFGKTLHPEDTSKETISKNPEVEELYKSSSLGVITTLGLGMYQCNTEFERMTGYTNDEINSLGISHIFHPEEKEETLEYMLRLHAGEIDSFNLRRRYIQKNGDHLWANVSTASIKNDKGELICHVVIVKDISEEQKIEQAFQESEIRFKQLFEASPLAILIRKVDSENYTQGNRAFFDMFGYEPHELQHLTRPDLMVGNDREELDPIMEKLVKKEIPNFQLEKRYKKKNGDTFWAVTTRSLVRIGNVDFLMGIVEDIDEKKKMEIALRENEAKIRSMFMGSSDKFVAIDKNYRIIYFNDSAANTLPKLFELQKLEEGVELLAKKNKKLLKLWIGHFDRALAGEKFEIEKKYPIGLRNRTDVVAFSPIKDQDGEIIGVSLIGKEVTKMLNTQEALKQSQANQMEAQKLVELGNWEYHASDFSFSWSAETRNIFKIPKDSPDPSDEAFYNMIHPEDQPILLQHTYDIFYHKKKLELILKCYNYENELMHIHVIGKPLFENGKLSKVFGTIQNITKQKKIELNLAKARDQYKDLFENMYDAIVITDSMGRMIDANKAAEKILGYSSEELRGLHIPEIVYPEDKERSKMYLDKLVTDGYYSGYEGRIIRKDGSICYIQVNSSAIKDDNGNLIGSRDIFRDITEIKLAEEKKEALLKELEDVNNELKEFAYIVSHDLKAPLRHIRSISDWLTEDFGEELGQKGVQQLKLLNNRVTRLHHFINGIFEYTKIGRIYQQKEMIDVLQLIRSSLEILDIPRNVTINLPEAIPNIYGEKIKLQQVFQNLITNAIKYNDKPQTEINIAYRNQQDYHLFSISDNGKGISKRNFKKIFQIFQTLQPKDNYESTGIGLTIVKRIVQQHGGKITVRSEIHKGTTFEFTLEK